MELPGEGVGGIAVADGMVLVGCRDILDQHDAFLAFSAETGGEAWRIEYPAKGQLDYGNSPRATPLIADGRVYLFGAFGHIHAVELETGLITWQKNLAVDFATPKLSWGLTGSPLIAGGRLIVQPGGRDACLVALDPAKGKILWKSEGGRPSHTSFIAASVSGATQVIGYDEKTLGGWDAETGERLWTVAPKLSGDFNVPTPILLDLGRLFVATENNAARIYEFAADGTLKPDFVARNPDLAPDCHSPVASEGRIYGVNDGLRCLDATTLKDIWAHEDDAFYHYASLIACKRRLLALTQDANLILLEDVGESCRELDRLALTDTEVETLSHPAIVGTRLYVRFGTTLACFELDPSRMD